MMASYPPPNYPCTLGECWSIFIVLAGRTLALPGKEHGTMKNRTPLQHVMDELGAAELSTYFERACAGRFPCPDDEVLSTLAVAAIDYFSSIAESHGYDERSGS